MPSLAKNLLMFDELFGCRRNADPIDIALTIVDNGDGTVQLNWTDASVRAEGQYDICENGVFVDSVAYNASLEYEATITDPVNDSRWQIKYRNDDGALRGVSSSKSIAGIKRSAESWRDYEHAVYVPAKRLTAASSQYLQMAHAADLNLTTAGTILIWCKKAQSMNQQNCVFLTKGTNGSDIVYGAYGGNYANLGGDTLSFKTATTSTDQSAEAGDYLGAFAWSFAPSVLKAARNGSIASVVNTPPAALTTNSQPIRIGGDGGLGTTWKYFDGWLFCVAIWNRTLSDADLLALTAGNVPPTYETLDDYIDGGTTGLIRWFDLGESLTCKVSAVTLTESGGSGAIENQIISTTDRSNSLVYSAPTGRWPTRSTGIFGSGVSAFHDALANEGGTVGMSRCTLRATLDQSNLPFTASSGRIVSAVRYTTSLHTTENWHDAVDSGAGVNRYILDGYIKISGTFYHALRYRDSTSGDVNISNGEWYSSQTPTTGVNYKNDWRYDGSVFTHKLNNSYDTPTALFNGATPAWVNGISAQLYSGTSLTGGGSALGHYGPAVKFNGYPSNAINNKTDAWFSDQYGFTQAESDLSGEAYAAAIEAAGYTYTGDDRQHDIDFFRNMRRDGILHLIKEGSLFGYGADAPNAVKLISRESGTFGGTVTHTVAGKVTFGASGRFNCDKNLTQLGLGAATDCGLCFIYANNDAAGTNIDLGMNNAGVSNFELTPNYNNSGRKGYIRFGGFADGTTSFDGLDLSAVTDVTGIWLMSRAGANAFLAFNNYTTHTVLASGSAFSGGSLPNVNPVLGCLNSGGTLSVYSQKAFRGWFITLGMTQAQGAAFTANIKTWLQARGFV